MTKKTKRRNRLSKRYSKNRLSRKRYSKNRHSKKRHSKKRLSRKRLSRKKMVSKRKMRGGSQNPPTGKPPPQFRSVFEDDSSDDEAQPAPAALEPAPAPANEAEAAEYLGLTLDQYQMGQGIHASLRETQARAALEKSKSVPGEPAPAPAPAPADEETEAALPMNSAEYQVQREEWAAFRAKQAEASASVLAPIAGQKHRGAEVRRMATEEATDLEGVTGLKKHKVQGDGDCMFTSVLYCNGEDVNLYRDYPCVRGLHYGGDTIRAIREKVANWLDENWENKFIERIMVLSDTDTSHRKQDSINEINNLVAETDETIEAMTEDAHLPKEGYIERIRKWNDGGPNAFGGNAELIALSNLLNLKITQYNRTPNRDEADTYIVKSCRIYEPKGGAAANEIYLVQRSGGGAQTAGDHYDSLIPGGGGEPPPPYSPGPEGTRLGIMRHSLRLDNELDKYGPNHKVNQNYWKNGFNYNTPLANDKNIVPPIEGVSLKNKANDKILSSILRGLIDHDFKCIITSPFTRCLQTANIVGIMLGIPPENIFINYNLREADTALALYNPIKYEVPHPVWDTLEPYNQELIAEIAKGRIEPYVKQTVNDIFNNYKYLGNVLLITHGDVYNKHGPKILGTNIGATRLEEAGWAIFQPPNNAIVHDAGDGFFEAL